MSGSDDSTRLVAEQARGRLDLERDERLAALMRKIERRRESGGCDEEDDEGSEIESRDWDHWGEV